LTFAVVALVSAGGRTARSIATGSIEQFRAATPRWRIVATAFAEARNGAVLGKPTVDSVGKSKR
jgi:hypothetical protein